jgi:hypothetical protein
MRGACSDGAHKYSSVSAQAVARSDARYALQVLDRSALAVSRGVARCASRLLDRGAQAVASLCVTGTWPWCL